MPLTRISLSTGQHTYITGTEPDAVALELEDLGSSWLKATVLEYDGLMHDPNSWYVRRCHLPHHLIVQVSELTDAERIEIPAEVLADHDESRVDR